MVKEKEVAKKSSSEKAVSKKKVAPKKDVAVKKVAPRKSVEQAAAPRVAAPRIVTAVSSVQKTVTPRPVVREKKEKKVGQAVCGVGRRKSSCARVWVTRGNGSISINGKAVELYFKTSETSVNAIKPLIITGSKALYDVAVNVSGGGNNSQSDAIKLGIARALVVHNDAFKPTLRQDGLLTVDSRIKERKKPGQRGARRKFQFVKR